MNENLFFKEIYFFLYFFKIIINFHALSCSMTFILYKKVSLMSSFSGLDKTVKTSIYSIKILSEEKKIWRKERDSNPRGVSLLDFESSGLSQTHPSFRVNWEKGWKKPVIKYLLCDIIIIKPFLDVKLEKSSNFIFAWAYQKSFAKGVGFPVP